MHRKKVVSPEREPHHGEKARSIFDGLLGTPSGFNWVPNVGRILFPSRKDKAVVEWRNELTEASNQHVDDIERLEHRAAASDERLQTLDQSVSEVRGAVRAVKPDFSFFEGELSGHRTLIESGFVRQALGILRSRYLTERARDDFPLTILGRAKALIAFCHHHLDEDEQASIMFKDAYELDPTDPKLTANRVLGFLLDEQFEEAFEFASLELPKDPTNASLAANYVHAHRLARIDGDPLENIDVSTRQSETVTHALLQWYRQREGDWKAFAQEALKRFPDDDLVRVFAAEGDLDEVVQTAHGNERALTSQEIGRASRAADVLRQSWEAHSATQRAVTEVELATLHNSLLGFFVAERYDSMAELVASARNYVEQRCELRRLATMAAFQRGDQDEIDMLLADRFENDFDVRLNHLIALEQWDEAVALIEDDSDQPSAANVIGLDAIEKCVRHLASRPNDIGSAFQEILEAATDTASAMTVARMAGHTGANDVSNEAYSKAPSLVDDRTPHELRLQVAHDAYLRGDAEAVVDLLEAHVDPTRDTLERRRLANAYVATVPRDRAKQFFDAWREAGPETFDLNALEGGYHFNRNDPQRALPLFRKALRERTHELQLFLALWSTLKRSRQDAEATRLVQQVDPVTMEGSPLRRMQLAHLMWMEGRPEAFDLAYEIAVVDQDNPEICAKYSGLFLLAMQGDRDIPVSAPSSVDEGVWVRLENGATKMEFVVSDAPSSHRWHRRRDDPFVRAVHGSSMNDDVEITVGPLTESWRVAEVKDKRLALFHELSNNFQNRFPEYPGLVSFTMKGNDVSPVLRMVRERAEFIDGVVSDYAKQRLPLGIAARAVGTNAIEFGISLARAKRQLISSVGTDEEGEAELGLAAGVDRSRGVVIDAYTAWFLASAGLLNVAKRLFGRLVVPQTAVDTLDRIIMGLPTGAGQGGTLAYGQGQYVLTETNSEIVGAERVRLQALREDIVAAADCVGTEVGSNLPLDLIRLLPGLDGALDALVVADRDDLPVISADLHLRGWTVLMLRRPAFGLRGLLDLAQQQNALSSIEIAEALVHMGRCGHNHLPVSARVLTDVLDLDRSDDGDRFRIMASHLGGVDADYQSHMVVATTFLNSITYDFPTDLRLQRATSAVFLGMVRMPHHTPTTIIRRLVDLARSETYPAQSSAMRAYGAQWLQGHFLHMARTGTAQVPSVTEDREANPEAT